MNMFLWVSTWGLIAGGYWGIGLALGVILLVRDIANWPTAEQREVLEIASQIERQERRKEIRDALRPRPTEMQREREAIERAERRKEIRARIKLDNLTKWAKEGK